MGPLGRMLSYRLYRVGYRLCCFFWLLGAPLILVVSFSLMIINVLHRDNYYTLRDRPVNDLGYEYVIKPDRCDAPKTPFLTIFILSHADHKQARDAIRKTWGGYPRHARWPHQDVLHANINIFFVFGNPQHFDSQSDIFAEGSKHRDIMQGRIPDAPRHESDKMLLALKWVVSECPRGKFIMFTTDEVFVNLPMVLDMITTRPVIGKEMFGRKYYTLADRDGDFEVDWLTFPQDQYPPFLSREGIIMRPACAKLLLETARYVRTIPRGDVYVAGILPKVIKRIRHMSPDGSFLYHEEPSNFTVCAFHRRLIYWSWTMSPEEMRGLWKLLGDGDWAMSCDQSKKEMEATLREMHAPPSLL